MPYLKQRVCLEYYLFCIVDKFYFEMMPERFICIYIYTYIIYIFVFHLMSKQCYVLVLVSSACETFVCARMQTRMHTHGCSLRRALPCMHACTQCVASCAQRSLFLFHSSEGTKEDLCCRSTPPPPLPSLPPSPPPPPFPLMFC